MKDNNFKLSEDQEMAIYLAKEFINSKDKYYNSFLLEGHAGTGKTTIVKMIIDYMRSIKKPFALCAPTHKAKRVLEDKTGCDSITLHSLLSMTPNLNIFDLDYSFLKFKSAGHSEFPIRGVVIIDESSMISDGLYRLLLEYSDMAKTKLIFVGDKAQLKAVDNIKISPLFNIENKTSLNTIHRQNKDNDIFDILNYLRANPITEWDNWNNLKSVNQYSNPWDFIDKAAESIRQSINISDVNYSKILAFRNIKVQSLNKAVRKIIYDKIDNIYPGEILTGYDNFSYNNMKFYNSSDYIVRKCNRVVKNIPFFKKMEGYDLLLFDPIYGFSSNVFVLDHNTMTDEDIVNLAQLIEGLRIEALNYQNNNNYLAKKKWRSYYSIMNSFGFMANLKWDNRTIKRKTFDFGYSLTVHKSQGSTLDNVFVDMVDVQKCLDKEQLRQLQYVALSRTTNKVELFV